MLGPMYAMPFRPPVSRALVVRPVSGRRIRPNCPENAQSWYLAMLRPSQRGVKRESEIRVRHKKKIDHLSKVVEKTL